MSRVLVAGGTGLIGKHLCRSLLEQGYEVAILSRSSRNLGHGKQYMPWIHIEDSCNIYMQAVKNKEMVGPYNAVAPEHVTNKVFTQKTAHALHRPSWFPNIPARLMKLFFGEMSDILLTGAGFQIRKLNPLDLPINFPILRVLSTSFILNKLKFTIGNWSLYSKYFDPNDVPALWRD
jgi:NAD dependent epimerase/dehydratase family enzyme